VLTFKTGLTCLRYIRLIGFSRKRLNNQKSFATRDQEVEAVIASTFRRPQFNVNPVETEGVFLRAGVGIDGDCHASPISPRQVLLAATGSYYQLGLAPNSLRENILIRVDRLSLSSGSLLLVGPDAALRITFECEPCGRLNRIRDGLSRDIKGKRGYLARVVRSGVVRPGDEVKVIKSVFPSFPDDWRDRVLNIVRMIPSNHIISYARLAELAGVPTSFCRSFPRLLRSHKNIPWQRVRSANQLIQGESGRRSLKVRQLTSKREWLGNVIFDDEVQFMSRTFPSERAS